MAKLLTTAVNIYSPYPKCYLSLTYGYGQRYYEDPAQGAQATRELAQECLGLDVVTHRGQGHQPPPDAVIE